MSSPTSAMDMDMEDGEIRKSPASKEPSLDTLSLTDEEEMMDNLEIKPPQARVHKSHRKAKHSASTKRHVATSEHRKKHHHSRTHREERHRHHRERKEDRSLKEHPPPLSTSRRHDMRREEREKAAKEEARVVVLMEEQQQQQRRDEKRREEELRSRAAREERRAEKEERRVDREERRAVREERRLERDIKDMLEHHRSQQTQASQLDGETSKEREERELRRQRLMEAERVKETYRKDMEERRARREQRERSRSRERKLEAEQAEVQAEMERAGLVVVSDESATPGEPGEIEDHTPVGESNGAASSTEEQEDEERRRRRRHSSSRESSSTESESEEEESSGEEEVREATPPRPATPVQAQDKSPVPSLPPYLPAIMGCRSVEEFHCLNRIEEGTYGVVYRAKDKRTEEIVALKRLKMEKEKEGFPITSLREINTLLKAQHPNIVCVKEIVVGSNMDKIFIVMDYVEHDLKSLMETMKQKKQAFVPGEVKCLMKQLLAAVSHLHDNWILHRDLKTSNLLLSHKGILRVGDFGLAREYGSPLKPYTSVVVTLWYRAPELLLGIKEYSTPIDMWSVGCIFAELLTMEPLFTGRTEVDQLNRIFKALGTPNERIWPGYSKLPAVQKMTFTEFPVSTIRNRFTNLSELGLALLNGFLTYNPSERMTAEEGLKHGYFSQVPLAIDPAMFPTWPAKSEPGHHRKKVASPKPPSGGRAYKQLEDTDEGFHMGQVERNRINLGPGFSLKF